MYKRLKDRVEDMFAFVEKQILFIQETTSHLSSTNEMIRTNRNAFRYWSTAK